LENSPRSYWEERTESRKGRVEDSLSLHNPLINNSNSIERLEELRNKAKDREPYKANPNKKDRKNYNKNNWKDKDRRGEYFSNSPKYPIQRCSLSGQLRNQDPYSSGYVSECSRDNYQKPHMNNYRQNNDYQRRDNSPMPPNNRYSLELNNTNSHQKQRRGHSQQRDFKDSRKPLAGQTRYREERGQNYRNDRDRNHRNDRDQNYNNNHQSKKYQKKKNDNFYPKDCYRNQNERENRNGLEPPRRISLLEKLGPIRENIDQSPSNYHPPPPPNYPPQPMRKRDNKMMSKNYEMNHQQNNMPPVQVLISIQIFL